MINPFEVFGETLRAIESPKFVIDHVIELVDAPDVLGRSIETQFGSVPTIASTEIIGSTALTEAATSSTTTMQPKQPELFSEENIAEARAKIDAVYDELKRDNPGFSTPLSDDSPSLS